MTRRGSHHTRRSLSADTILWYIERDGSIGYSEARGPALRQLVADGIVVVTKFARERGQRVVRCEAPKL